MAEKEGLVDDGVVGSKTWNTEDSDVRGNRSDQMELLSPTSGRSINRNNTIASVRVGLPRSMHLKESSRLDGSRGAREPSTPQSPL